MNNVFDEFNKSYDEAESTIPLSEFFKTAIVIIADDARKYDGQFVADAFAADYSEEELKEAQDRPRRNPATRIIASREEVQQVLMELQETENFNIIRRDKNIEFMEANNLSNEDVAKVIKQLTIGDYVCNLSSYNPLFFGNTLKVFIPDKEFELADGRTISGISIYIKVDDCVEGRVAIISFHEAERQEEHPYMDSAPASEDPTPEPELV